ncbi:MAG: PAS domain-containing sensor histidine kinase [Chloroflexota bacterium]
MDRQYTQQEDANTYLQAVLDSSQQGIMAFSTIRDDDNTIVDFCWEMVNKKSEAMTGRTADDLIGKYLLVEMPGNGEDGLFDKYVGVVETGIPIDFEHYYEHEGLKTWFRITARKLHDGFVVRFDDITLQKRLQKDVQDKYDRLNHFFEVTPDLLCIANFDGYFTKLNPAWESVLGYTIEELKAQPYLILIHPDDIEKTRDAIDKLSQGHAITNFQNRYRHKDGSYRLLDWRASTDYEQNRLYAAARDVTNEQAIKNRLAASEERFATAFNSNPVPMVLSTTIDDESYFADVNDAYLELTGYRRDELIGKRMREIVLGMGVSSAQRNERIQTLQTIGQYRMREITLTNRHGERRDVLISSTRMQIDDGSLTVEILLDVTEQRRAEETAFELRLEQARAQMITQFVRASSHEFKTPLAIIQSSAYLVTRTDDKSLIASKAVQIKHQVERINKLVTMLQHISKLQTDNKGLLRPTKIDTLIERVITQVARTTVSNCSLTLTIDNDLDVVCINEDDIENALRQVLNNAIQYGKPDTRTDVDIHVSQDDDNIHIRVSDNGIGIAETDLADIFDPFFRVNQARTHAGWGLGLTLAKTVCERHGGDITVDSMYGEGSAFTILLPICGDTC